MEIFDLGSYNECRSAAAQLMFAATIIDGFDELDVGVVTDDEYDEYVIPAIGLLEKLATIVGKRAKLYIKEE